MNLRSTLLTLLMPACLWLPVAHAAPPTGVQIEISFLLGYIEGSGCEFYRNGTWNNARAAQAHLRDKYRYLAQKNEIETAEQFIDKAATESSLSGQAYMVRCNGGAALTSRQWLRDELVRLRAY